MPLCTPRNLRWRYQQLCRSAAEQPACFASLSAEALPPPVPSCPLAQAAGEGIPGGGAAFRARRAHPVQPCSGVRQHRGGAAVGAGVAKGRGWGVGRRACVRASRPCLLNCRCRQLMREVAFVGRRRSIFPCLPNRHGNSACRRNHGRPGLSRACSSWRLLRVVAHRVGVAPVPAGAGRQGHVVPPGR